MATGGCSARTRSGARPARRREAQVRVPVGAPDVPTEPPAQGAQLGALRGPPRQMAGHWSTSHSFAARPTPSRSDRRAGDHGRPETSTDVVTRGRGPYLEDGSRTVPMTAPRVTLTGSQNSSDDGLIGQGVGSARTYSYREIPARAALAANTSSRVIGDVANRHRDRHDCTIQASHAICMSLRCPARRCQEPLSVTGGAAGDGWGRPRVGA